MASQSSSNSQFFQWIQTTANKGVNTGANAASMLTNRLYRDTIEVNKRKPLYQLMRATDEHLKDIGIKRADLKTSLELPLSINAGQWLERRRKSD